MTHDPPLPGYAGFALPPNWPSQYPPGYPFSPAERAAIEARDRYLRAVADLPPHPAVTLAPDGPGRQDRLTLPDDGWMTVYGVALVFTPRPGVERTAFVAVRLIAAPGKAALSPKDAITRATEIALESWPPDQGKPEEYETPTGALSTLIMQTVSVPVEDAG